MPPRLMTDKRADKYGLIAGAAVLGLVSVVYDALGSHLLELSAKQAGSLGVATHYGIVHAVLIIGLALMRFTDMPAAVVKRLSVAGTIFCVGAILFSFSIYISVSTGIPQVTAITPLGGIALMGGWLSLLWVGAGFRKRNAG